jgi:hypothetical protein
LSLPENFRIKGVFIGKDNGYNASSYGVNADYFGNSRPIDAGWDIGAYEYVSNGSDITAPSSPSGLSVR